MAIHELMTSTGASFKATVNELLRSGLRSRSQTPAAPFAVRTYDTGAVVGGIGLDEAIARATARDDEQLLAALRSSTSGTSA